MIPLGQNAVELSPGNDRSWLHSCRIWKAIEAVGAKLLYPSPYAPDLNPIETAFSN
jgi:transposase